MKYLILPLLLTGCAILDDGPRERALIEETARSNSQMLKDIKDQLIRLEMTLQYKVQAQKP